MPCAFAVAFAFAPAPAPAPAPAITCYVAIAVTPSAHESVQRAKRRATTAPPSLRPGALTALRSGALSVPLVTVLFMRNAAFRPSLPVRVIMLSAAYAPLLLLLAVLDSFRLPWLRWVFVILAIGGVVGTLLFLTRSIPGRNATPEKVYSAKPREGEALKFFASYVVPFFVTATAASPARWGLLIYLVMIALLYLQGDMYFSNPVLAALGYRIFELARADRGFLLVISRAWHLAPGETISLVPLGGYIFVQQKENRQ